MSTDSPAAGAKPQHLIFSSGYAQPMKLEDDERRFFAVEVHPSRTAHGQAVGSQPSSSPGNHPAADTLAAKLQRVECAADRAHRRTGYEFHRGAAHSYQHAMELLLQQFPSALPAALAVLDKDIDGLARAEYRERLSTQPLQLATQSADADLGRPAVEQLNDGVFAAAALNSDEAALAVPAHDKA